MGCKGQYSMNLGNLWGTRKEAVLVGVRNAHWHWYQCCSSTVSVVLVISRYVSSELILWMADERLSCVRVAEIRNRFRRRLGRESRPKWTTLTLTASPDVSPPRSTIIKNPPQITIYIDYNRYPHQLCA